ncbi:MAG: phage integrase N-terminal SAM-like domain-containing protein [Verrucomicrobiales bacterium]|nr:phage integrase N-terminal SAM-like domain-containing protein [Verrucomicrobiales bacterium]
MQNNNNANPDNQPHQSPARALRQAKTPPARTDEAGYQKLPHGYRPLVGRAQRDPLDYDSHPYPSMRHFAEFLALRFDTPRTRHSYYRQMRLVHEFCQCDPAAINEARLRDYVLHVKTAKRWKPKTIRQAAAAAKLFGSSLSVHDASRGVVDNIPSPCCPLNLEGVADMRRSTFTSSATHQHLLLCRRHTSL